MKALNLKTERRPTPYKIARIKKAPEVHVIQACKVPLPKRKYYKDEVIYDVIDMDACYL